MNFRIEESFLIWPEDENQQCQEPPKWDEDSEKSPNSTVKKASRYSVRDDLEILRYIRSKPDQGYMSRRFWKRAIEVDSLLNKTRTIDSLRDRYRHHLRTYTDEDFLDLEKCVEASSRSVELETKTECTRCASEFIPSRRGKVQVNSGNHEISKETKLQKYPKPDIAREHLRKDVNEDFELLVDESGGTSKAVKSVHVDPSKLPQMSQKLSLDYQPVNCKTPDEVEAEEPANQREFSIINATNPNLRVARENCQNLLNTRLLDIISQNQDNVAVKRKYYLKMMEIDQLLHKKKVPKEEIGTNRTRETDFSNTGSRSFFPNKDNLEELFFCCSMNQDNVEKYLQGETYLLWTEQEDQLILGPIKEIGKVILSRYKGSQNVAQRVEFLERWEACKQSMIKQPTKSDD